jgi:uncharacterized membrane protein
MAEKTEVNAEPAPSLVTVTHLMYALHALSLLIGVTTAATIVGAFVFGVPSIIAVVINYVKRGEARGTFLESHFRWQIRTFWFALLWCMIGAMLFATFLGIPLAVGIWLAAGVWAIYRIESRCMPALDCRSNLILDYMLFILPARDSGGRCLAR